MSDGYASRLQLKAVTKHRPIRWQKKNIKTISPSLSDNRVKSPACPSRTSDAKTGVSLISNKSSGQIDSVGVANAYNFNRFKTGKGSVSLSRTFKRDSAESVARLRGNTDAGLSSNVEKM